MPKKPFTSEVMTTYADRLVRHALLAHSIDDPSHPCMVAESSLLRASEAEIRASADYCRRTPEWPMLRSWFPARVMELARSSLPRYGFSFSVGNSVLAKISSRGFDHLLESRTGESGVRPSPGSNVLFPSQCKTS